MVAIDIAQVFFSSDHVRMFAAMDQALLRAHFVFNLQLTGKTLLIEDSVPVIENRQVAQRRCLMPMSAALLRIPRRVVMKATARSQA